jgi:hypothetical protein
MFLLVPSDNPTKWKAVISQDNLTIEWPKGPNGEMTEPPWMDLYMERYDKEFQAALSSYRSAEVNFRKLGSVETHSVENPELF